MMVAAAAAAPAPLTLSRRRTVTGTQAGGPSRLPEEGTAARHADAGTLGFRYCD